MEPSDVEHLSRHFQSSTVTLVTGSGFSCDARDANGASVPTVQELQKDLWQLCFGDDEPEEDFSLGDIYQFALTRRRDALTSFLRRRLRVDPKTLPDHFVLWFSRQWRRIYTLNVDDLEDAATKAFPIVRPMRSISAVSGTARGSGEGALEVIHLNGMIDEDPELLTFSWPQYGERLSSLDRYYRGMVRDWAAGPVVFVGTRLDEPVLWQHLRSGVAPERHPRSFLVVPQLSPPKQALLGDYGIVWIPTTAAEFAEQVLRPMP